MLGLHRISPIRKTMLVSTVPTLWQKFWKHVWNFWVLSNAALVAERRNMINLVHKMLKEKRKAWGLRKKWCATSNKTICVPIPFVSEQVDRLQMGLAAATKLFSLDIWRMQSKIATGGANK